MRQRLVAASLVLSAAGLVSLALKEGYTDQAVRPLPGDVPTYGFGTTTKTDGTPVKIGDKITPPQALARKFDDIQKFEGAIKKCVHVPLYQYEYDAYLSLAYNIGQSAFCTSTLVSKLNVSDYTGACREILRWNRFKGQVVNGLTIRRESEYKTCIGS
jgi:lysozyme